MRVTTVADVTGWEPDVLPGYWQQTLALGADPDGEGDLVATLVSRGEPPSRGERAVLVVHGYTDYFFHTELADHFAGRGFAFYALDLPKCGRSAETDRPRTSPPIWRTMTARSRRPWTPSAPPTCWCTGIRRAD